MHNIMIEKINFRERQMAARTHVQMLGCANARGDNNTEKSPFDNICVTIAEDG